MATKSTATAEEIKTAKRELTRENTAESPVVQALNGQVANAFDVERAFWDKKAGQAIDVHVVRQGQTLTVQVTLTPAHGAGQAVAVLPMLPGTSQPTPTVSVPTADQQ